jgi:hypothetical protein
MTDAESDKFEILLDHLKRNLYLSLEGDRHGVILLMEEG